MAQNEHSAVSSSTAATTAAGADIVVEGSMRRAALAALSAGLTGKIDHAAGKADVAENAEIQKSTVKTARAAAAPATYRATASDVVVDAAARTAVRIADRTASSPARNPPILWRADLRFRRTDASGVGTRVAACGC